METDWFAELVKKYFPEEGNKTTENENNLKNLEKMENTKSPTEPTKKVEKVEVVAETSIEEINLQLIKEVFTDVFKEACLDFNILEDLPESIGPRRSICADYPDLTDLKNILTCSIKFDEILIKNRDGLSHCIKDLFVVIPFNLSTGTLLGALFGTRTSVSQVEVAEDYVHSHLSSAARKLRRMGTFCLGSTPLNRTVVNLKLPSKDKKVKVPLLYELATTLPGYVHWESLDGGPYRYMHKLINNGSTGIRSMSRNPRNWRNADIRTLFYCMQTVSANELKKFFTITSSSLPSEEQTYKVKINAEAFSDFIVRKAGGDTSFFAYEINGNYFNHYNALKVIEASKGIEQEEKVINNLGSHIFFKGVSHDLKHYDHLNPKINKQKEREEKSKEKISLSSLPITFNPAVIKAFEEELSTLLNLKLLKIN